MYGDLKREELVRSGSVVLHELYFANLGGDPKPGGKVLDVIKQWFGSYEQWEDEFKKTANALGGGSGWVIFAQNAHTGEFHNYWSWDHMHNVPMGRPLLVLDMYEHAYHMDYGAAAAKYVDAFMQNVNWEEVNRRTEAVLIALHRAFRLPADRVHLRAVIERRIKLTSALRCQIHKIPDRSQLIYATLLYVGVQAGMTTIKVA